MLHEGDSAPGPAAQRHSEREIEPAAPSSEAREMSRVLDAAPGPALTNR